MYDIAIIGGGINGCGIARDAAGNGQSVLLAEQDDLASGTSSWSTKLIHGGLRYLEHYEFRLVREALIERETLWAIAPHIIHPARFVLPHHRALRPAWLLRLGLFLYDHLGGRKTLPGTRVLDLRHDLAGQPLKADYVRGFEYSDCTVDDSRLVVLNARDAAARGADIRVRTRVASAIRMKDGWKLGLKDKKSGATSTVTARVVVNASGPWIDHVLNGVLGKKDAHNIRLVKGSHIVVPKLFGHDRSYIFQNADGRIVFAIPYHHDFTLVGTTDVDYDGDPEAAHISDDEIAYLCSTLNGYFRTPVSPADIVWSFAGVRPLVDDKADKAQETTRDYVIREERGKDGNQALLVNILGGKLTTYRRLSEDVTESACKALGKPWRSWTGDAALPGGGFPLTGLPDLQEKLVSAFPWVGHDNAHRLVATYGTEALRMLDGAGKPADMGKHFGAGLHEREVQYLVENEWAQTAADILWRRTKLGLRLSKQQTGALEKWLEQRERR